MRWARWAVLFVAMGGGFGCSMAGKRAAPKIGPLAYAPGTLATKGSAVAQVALPDRIRRVAPLAGVVDMMQVPNLPARNTMLDRWRAGQRDMGRADSPIPAEEAARLRREALRLPPSDRIQILTPASSPRTPGMFLSFDSIDIVDCCGGSGANVPPDPDLAVGPNHVIAVVNVAFEIYDKAGNSLLGPRAFAALFVNQLQIGEFEFDPVVVYDPYADRFIMAIDALDQFTLASTLLVAASRTSDPTGQWNLYEFNTNVPGVTGNFNDYPHIGLGHDELFMGGNLFNLFSGNFLEGRIWAFDKHALYAGTAVTQAGRGIGFDDSPQPISTRAGDGPGPHFFIANVDNVNYSIYSWNNPLTRDDLQLLGAVNLVSAIGVPSGFVVDSPQLGGGAITANDLRPLDLEYRNGRVWTTGHIGCNPGAGTVNCVRWAEIDPTVPPRVVQAGVVASNAEFRTFPDLAVDACNNMAVGYSKFSASTWPAIFYAGRRSGDPPGTLQGEAQLKAGELVYLDFLDPPRRWGDYTGMAIAPDEANFWYLGEYSKRTGSSNGRWGNYVGGFSYGCNPLAFASITPSRITSAVPTTIYMDVGFPPGGLLGASVTYNGADVTNLVVPFITFANSSSARLAIRNLVFPPGTNATIGLNIVTTQGSPSATLQIQVP